MPGIYSVLRLLITLLLLTTIFNTPSIYSSDYLSCEVSGVVVDVIDGDTFDLNVTIVYSDRYLDLQRRVIRIRFADVNAPELNTREGGVSRDIVNYLISNSSGVVCLDIDDYDSPVDRYGRYIAVVLIPYNETKWLNLNKWLLDNKYVELMDFKDNEFDPGKWSLYVAITPLNETATSYIVEDGERDIVVLSPYIVILIILGLITILALYSISPGKRK